MEFNEEPTDVNISSDVAGFSKEEIDYVNVSPITTPFFCRIN